MYNIKMTIAYDGTRFLGWQKTNLDIVQPQALSSVEYIVQSCLEQILQHPVSVNAASRTDRGVHAVGQIVTFIAHKDTLNLIALAHSLNSILPGDIRILHAEFAESTFHATLDSKAKQYIYRIFTGPVLLPSLRFTYWHIPETFDREKMITCAHILIGEHDFIAFRNHRKGNDYNDTVRTIYSIDFVDTDPDCLEIKITGNNFLYKMCRNIVGTLIYVGQGKISPGSVVQLLSGGKRSDAGITAPALGLTLNKVYYSPVYAHDTNPGFGK